MELAADITAEDIEVFLQEADENLIALDESIVQLEKDQDNPQLLQEIFRIAHTFKGSSAMFGYRQMTDLAHAMESLFELVRQGKIAVSTPVIDALLHSLDVLRILRDDLANSEDSQVNIQPVVQELETVIAEASGSAPAPRQSATPSLTLDHTALQVLQTAQLTGQSVFQVKVSLDPESAWASVRCFQVMQGLSLLGEIIISRPSAEEIEAQEVGAEIQIILVTDHDKSALSAPLNTIEDVVNVEVEPYTPEQMEASKDPTTEGPSRKTPAQAQTVRIDVERLDHLMNTIGELVIDRTRILQISKMLETRYKEDELVQALGETSAHVVKVVDELQEEIMKARMLPIGTVLNGFPRMVRDLSLKMGKKVNFVVDGQDTEIDRTVIEKIRDPMIHLLRNSVDHGIETPAERLAAGKPEEGTLTLTAFQEHSYIIIVVEDDGRGIDPEKVRSSAVKKGIISADAASRLSDSEAVELIFAPGFSTAEQTTDVSGRGVGMDIVKTNIESINGFVELDTKVGRGCKMTVRLPLTLATIQALLFSVDNTVYAVPLVYVLEAVNLEPGDVQTIEGKEVIRLRGTVVPLLRVSQAFKLAKGESDGPEKTHVVVVRVADKLVGLAVDALRELQEITVKSLGNYMGDVKGIAGVSILGDGQVVLIMDVPTLISTSIDKGGNKGGNKTELTAEKIS